MKVDRRENFNRGELTSNSNWPTHFQTNTKERAVLGKPQKSYFCSGPATKALEFSGHRNFFVCFFLFSPKIAEKGFF